MGLEMDPDWCISVFQKKLSRQVFFGNVQLLVCERHLLLHTAAHIPKLIFLPSFHPMCFTYFRNRQTVFYFHSHLKDPLTPDAEPK